LQREAAIVPLWLRNYWHESAHPQFCAVQGSHRMSIFEDVVAEFGKSFPSDEYRQLTGHTKINSYVLTAESLLRQFLKEFEELEGVKIEFAIVDSADVNACAFSTSHGKYGIIICLGYVYFLAGVLARAIEGNVLDAHLVGRLVNLHNEKDVPRQIDIDAEMRGEHWASADFDDPQQQFFPVFHTALSWLMGHELTHILHGHCDAYAHAGLHLNEAVASISEPINYSKSMEIDADCGATFCTFMMFMLTKNGLEEEGKVALYIFSLSCMIGLTVLLIGNGGKDIETDSHPRNLLRRSLMVKNIRSAAVNLNWNSADDYLAINVADTANWSVFMSGLGLGFIKSLENWGNTVDPAIFAEINAEADLLDIQTGGRRRFPKPEY
jgi:hypothetical protein